MNLIKQLGGYQNTKCYLESCGDMDSIGGFTPIEIGQALLEYRRENSIFEVGDKVVFNSYKLDAGISVIHKYHNGCIVAVFRHATDEEIKVGHRI